jgi:hypothetical protein
MGPLELLDALRLAALRVPGTDLAGAECNGAARALLGDDPWLPRVHPADRAELARVARERVETRTSFRLTRDNLAFRWLHAEVRLHEGARIVVLTEPTHARPPTRRCKT